ncbi:glyoxylate dehydrogenase [Fomitiporia mediterranea MF3/22]|uniref:glyoxylate dehydrogenase n=1 Tax=Fomitiporia mediterranea (strain MF3/22) TaxID=694068 RepID=UPI00044085EA|nr:glyoxylate dehydrogenase [Fomitiporia mediterranea MF3/22]EJD07962.1 glyoxylate dehydrogenase [Fomitiporia mediterranea MF3/22]
MASVISGDTVAEHNNRDSCWIVIHGNVYDVTNFLDEHPGGAAIILKYAGADATKAYEPIHASDVVTTHLPKEKHLGPVDLATAKQVVEIKTPEQRKREALMAARPPLQEILNLFDFEVLARSLLPPKTWAYYSSGSDDEIALRENHNAFQRVWFRPRVLRNVSNVDMSHNILGCKSSMPFYISAMALGKLGHPDGELCLTRAAGKNGIIQMISTFASFTFDEIVDATAPDQVLFSQLYVNQNRELTKKYVENAEKRGIKALFITVDAPQLGRREKDMRMKNADDGGNDGGAKIQEGQKVEKGEGHTRAISSFIDPRLDWEDIKWFQTITKMPIILKGVATWEDTVLAINAGCQGVVLSNHGGRQLDMARSGLEILVEVIDELKKRQLWPNPNFHIFVDGGVRRSSDILKALALGASAVGIGKGFLYSYCAYGQEGVEHAINILRDEMIMDMRMLGITKLSELVPEMVDARGLTQHTVPSPEHVLYNNTYEKLQLAKFREAKL